MHDEGMEFLQPIRGHRAGGMKGSMAILLAG